MYPLVSQMVRPDVIGNYASCGGGSRHRCFVWVPMLLLASYHVISALSPFHRERTFFTAAQRLPAYILLYQVIVNRKQSLRYCIGSEFACNLKIYCDVICHVRSTDPTRFLDACVVGREKAQQLYTQSGTTAAAMLCGIRHRGRGALGRKQPGRPYEKNHESRQLHV